MTDQQLIWQHFQNNAQESFAAAHPRLDFLVHRIDRLANHGAAVLNIGVGDGYFERQAQCRGWQIEALDPDKQAIERLCTQGIKARVGTLDQLPQPDGSMDFIVLSEVMEHLTAAQRTRALDEIHRVLKPGGVFLGTVPHAENLSDQETACPHCGTVFHRWGHQHSFTCRDVRKLIAERFVVERVSRTAFVNLRRGARGFIKGLFRKSLAKFGEPIAIATIWWIARK